MDTKQMIKDVLTSVDQYTAVTHNLPDELIHWKQTAERWSIIEVLCHVEEVIPYWLGEIQNLIATPGTEWGRGLQDPARLLAVANADSRPIAEVLQNITDSKPALNSILSSITEQQLSAEAPSRNPRFGTKPLSFVIEHLLVQHLASHINQIQNNISAYQSA